MSNNNYPSCLIEELAKYGAQPTYNLDWDRAVLATLRNRYSDNVRYSAMELGNVITKIDKDVKNAKRAYADLTDAGVYQMHMNIFLHVANTIVLAPQRRQFIVDENNSDVIRFLLLYFNDCPLAESVFPGRGYKLHKNIMLQGGVGVGKTMLMQVFSEYLRRTNNPRGFYNVSVTQMVNHYSIHNDIDSYLYNIRETKSFQGKPVNICLNDIGVDNRPFYGIDTTTIIHDFLHARNEIWANQGEYDRKFAHLTTNLTSEQLEKKFGLKDEYGRIVDRFKTYNVIPLPGKSRR